MDESEYYAKAEQAFRRIEDALKDADPDVVDCERSGDVLTLTFGGNKRCIVNTQRPTRQIWVAANARAWHFAFDARRGEWRDDKTGADELYTVLSGIVREQAGVDLPFAGA